MKHCCNTQLAMPSWIFGKCFDDSGQIDQDQPISSDVKTRNPNRPVPRKTHLSRIFTECFLATPHPHKFSLLPNQNSTNCGKSAHGASSCWPRLLLHARVQVVSTAVSRQHTASCPFCLVSGFSHKHTVCFVPSILPSHRHTAFQATTKVRETLLQHALLVPRRLYGQGVPRPCH